MIRQRRRWNSDAGRWGWILMQPKETEEEMKTPVKIHQAINLEAIPVKDHAGRYEKLLPQKTG